jgi:hypothetical protein
MVIRAMEPISSRGDYAQSTERSTQMSAVRPAEPRPNPAPPSAADPESRTRLLVRQNPWVTRFWMELTPAQQARIERQLHRGNMRLAAGQGEPAAIWDPMGLSDRVGLVFGRVPSAEPPVSPERRDDSTLAGNS